LFDGVLTPLSTIFQLYRGGQFYWRTRSHWQTLSPNVVHLVLVEIRTHNYHTITAMTAPRKLENMQYNSRRKNDKKSVKTPKG